ncbi:hypothetical protein [Alienimonas chondri]|uniref:Tyrosine specific protein phosphatases domain-containing protein n=1 Tax=Alienimonas chondri TaxID=2681879 RepID=A0ABX1VH68_9PLAN|nr:hypothetical protein [Alienimonas chondri]NNJ27430.1 hypothetical protein [Alienimonas chondri]
MSAFAFALLLIGSPLEEGAPEHLLAVAPGLWSGAGPHEDAHFAALAKLGVKTVVSVDGPVPNADAARRHGLRTVHVPIGYDGVPPDAAATLAAVMERFGPTAEGEQAAPGGVFVHCHHGKHRGPSGVAVCGLAAGLIDRDGALAVMKQAGTASRYTGLWESVRHFDPAALPPHAAPPDEFPEAVPPEGLTAAMDSIDALLEELNAAADDEERAEQTTTSLATLLSEQLQESARLPGLTDAVRADLRHAATLAEHAHTAAGRAALTQDCVRCHTVHRD